MKRFGRASLAGALLIALLGVAAPAGAQAGSVAVERENFRAEPGGRILAELFEGARLALGESRGQWREATLEAWIWGRSVHEQQRPELDLLVNADGENLRDGPSGDRVGRALGGMRLQRLERRGDWIRVRRTGWIWSASLASIGAGPEAERLSTTPPQETAPDRDTASVTAPAPGTARAPDTAAARDPAAPGPRERGREFATLGRGGIVMESVAGDTVARLRSGASVEVLAREGEWSRVRVEGWMLAAELSDSAGADRGVLTALHPDSLLARPERYRGRVVEWTVQFIALRNAERFRTDFLEGEPFMLTRGPDDHPGFVYVAVPAELLAEVERLAPLQRLRILGRIRTARSSLTDAPVLDLLEVEGR